MPSQYPGLRNLKFSTYDWLAFAAILIISVWYILGIPNVPFHPDESTQIFMSSDFETLFRNPDEIIFSTNSAVSDRHQYRLLDAPLTRYLIGFGRLITSSDTTPVDWDWSLGWEDNNQAGSLPSPKLLAVARFSVAALLPLSLIFAYDFGKQFANPLTGLLTVLLIGTNALVLLHTRRAMAESALFLGVCLSLWSYPKAANRPWLAGLMAALAFNAKQSAFAFFPVGLLAAAWFYNSPSPQARYRKITSNIFIYSLVFGFLTLSLNPFLWSNPLEGIRDSWVARQALLERQVAGTAELAPEQLLETPSQRTAALIANIYITPPVFAEVGNYLDATKPFQERYLAIPGNNIARTMLGGGLFFMLTITGMLLSLLKARRSEAHQRRIIFLVMAATLSVGAALIITVPLPWQRYVIPLIPLTSLWAAFAAAYPFATIAGNRPTMST